MFTLAHLTRIQIGPRAVDRTGRGHESPTEASGGHPREFQFEICVRIYPLQTTLMCDRVL